MGVCSLGFQNHSLKRKTKSQQLSLYGLIGHMPLCVTDGETEEKKVNKMSSLTYHVGSRILVRGQGFYFLIQTGRTLRGHLFL